jgi:hypothetical protein
MSVKEKLMSKNALEIGDVLYDSHNDRLIVIEQIGNTYIMFSDEFMDDNIRFVRPSQFIKEYKYYVFIDTREQVMGEKQDINGCDIDFSTIEFNGIDYKDYPDFCDAFISYAEFDDGTELTDDELDELNEDRDFVYERLMNYLF